MSPKAPTSMLLTLAALSISLLAGCATKVPFTHELRVQHDLSREDVRQLQFYTSHDIVLRREVESTARRITGGELKLASGKLIEEVVIKEGTPGVALDVEEDFITVSFEPGSALSFSLRNGRPEPQPLRQAPSLGFAEPPPDAFPGEHRHEQVHRPLDALIGNYFLRTDDASFVTFRSKDWEAIQTSFQAHLQIDAEELDEVVESHTVLEGRRISKRKTLPLVSF